MVLDSINRELYELAAQVGEYLCARGQMAVTAESCTGGWVAKVLTDVPGSSGWFDRGFVTYTNQAKIDLLGVRSQTLECHGAVSEATVREMVSGALERSAGDVALAVSGIAGPTGGTPDKPVGTVWLAWRLRIGGTAVEKHCFDGDREMVRRQSVIVALQGVLRFG